jgi:hypothetical protein
MNGRPVKTKRAGDLAATSPNAFNPADDTAFVCCAQYECEHAETRVEILPPGSLHFGKEICRNCDRVLRFVPKPATAARLTTNAFRLAKLTMISPALTPWEQQFITSISRVKKLSPRQQAVLDRIYAERTAARAR